MSTVAVANAFVNINQYFSWGLLFSQLRTLHIRRIQIRGALNEDVSKFERSISRIILAAPVLEQVDLGGIYSHSNSVVDLDEPLSLGCISTTIGLRHLKELNLLSFECTERDMLKFLIRHSERLEYVRFNEVTMTSGDWSSIVKRVREKKWPCLKEFRLSSCVEGHSELRLSGNIFVTDYVTCLQDGNPVEIFKNEPRYEPWDAGDASE